MGMRVYPPEARHVSQMLTDTIGKKVQANEVSYPEFPPDFATAVYTSEAGTILGVCICDLKLAACFGAALSLIPADTAIKMAEEGELSGMVRASTYEVFNIIVGLFAKRPVKVDEVHQLKKGMVSQIENRPNFRVILRDFYLPPHSLPAELSALLKMPSDRLDAEVTVERYTTGLISFIAVENKDE